MRVEAATTCGTDVKMWRRGHPILARLPGARSVTRWPACATTPASACWSATPSPAAPAAPCRGRAAADLPVAALGPRRLRGADRRARGRAAPGARTGSMPPARRWPSRSPRRCTRSIARRRRALAPDAGVLGGGPMGQMLAALLVAEGRTVTLADRHPERRAQAEALGAHGRRAARRPRRRLRGGRPAGGLARRGAGLRAGRLRRARRRLRGRHRRRRCRPARCTTTSSTSAARSTTRPPRSTARSRCWPTAPSTGARSPRARSGSTTSRRRSRRRQRRPGAQVGRRRRARRPRDRRVRGPRRAAAGPARSGRAVRRCSRIRRESQIASRPSTSTGTTRWPVSASTSSRRARAPGHAPLLDLVCRCRAQRARDPPARAEPVGRRPAAVEHGGLSGRAGHPRSRRVRGRAPASCSGDRLARGARVSRSPSRSCHQRDRLLDRVLVRARRPAQLAPRLRAAARPPVARPRGSRPAMTSARPGARSAASASASASRDGQLEQRALDARQPRELGEQPLPRVVARAEDVALARHAALVGQQVPGGDVAHVDDVDRAGDVGRDPAQQEAAHDAGRVGRRVAAARTRGLGRRSRAASPRAATRSASASAACLDSA